MEKYKHFDCIIANDFGTMRITKDVCNKTKTTLLLYKNRQVIAFGNEAWTKFRHFILIYPNKFKYFFFSLQNYSRCHPTYYSKLSENIEDSKQRFFNKKIIWINRIEVSYELVNLCKITSPTIWKNYWKLKYACLVDGFSQSPFYNTDSNNIMITNTTLKYKRHIFSVLKRSTQLARIPFFINFRIFNTIMELFLENHINKHRFIHNINNKVYIIDCFLVFVNKDKEMKVRQ
ncbi:hypothetical protein RFI_25809, partial [Reticulomyxa filosa]